MISEFARLTSDNEPARALNNVFAAETSHLEIDAWRHLVEQARLALYVPTAQAFLIGLDQTADYDSPNYIWWRQRRERFLYIDRIVVAEQAQGRGLGKALYLSAITAAKEIDLERVVCEINIEPLNARSVAFHQQLGFVKAGAQSFSGGKTVGYFERSL